jgi:hypothetical protein
MAFDQRSSVSQVAVPLIRDRIGLAVFALIALIVIGGAYVYGQRASAEAARDRATAIEDENHTFCNSLGLAPASEVYGRCTDGLLAVRLRHEERLKSDLSML